MRRLSASATRLVLVLSVMVLTLDAIAIGLLYQAVGICLLLGATYRLTRRRWRLTGNFGTARRAGLPDLLHGGLLSERGLILGRVGNAARPAIGQALHSLFSHMPAEWSVRMCYAALTGSRRAAGDFIRINDFIHLATFAPAGGGKSVSVLYPNLLSYDGNCVVIDPKGELYKVTHKHRQAKFGHTIVRLDPAGLYGDGAARFNPFDYIDASRPDFIEVCRDIANMLVVRTGKELDPHWCDSAENVIAAFTAYICALEGNKDARNLRGVKAQIANPDNFKSALEVMQRTEGYYGVLEELGHSLKWHVDKELGSVMTHAQRFTNIFGAPLVAESTGSTSFDPMELRNGRMTIYIITPPDKMVTWQALQRLWLGTLLRVITRGVPTEKNPVLFLIDECAHIGKMQALEDAVTLMRGMGIRLWLFFQSIDQLKKCFGDNAATVFDNLATQQYFAINSYETAKAISDRIGDETIVVRTEGTSWSVQSPIGGDGRQGGNRSSSGNTNIQEKERRLYRPEEVLRLPESTAVVFHKNNHVIVCDKIRYYADRAFCKRGIIFRRFGTGRTQGMGLRTLGLGLAAAAVSVAATLGVIGLRESSLRRPVSSFSTVSQASAGDSLPPHQVRGRHYRPVSRGFHP